MASERAQWGSRFGFVLAAAGSAVGLGNIWKFPYITGENGGGLFVLIYLICIALVGVPIMVAEIMIGRASQRQPVAAFHAIEGRRSPWAAIGWLGILAGFIILSFYVVVAGWAMDYTLKSVVNFTRPIHDRAELVASQQIATLSMEELRSVVIEDRARREARDEVAALRRSVPPSTWAEQARFEAAVAGSPDRDAAWDRIVRTEAMAEALARAGRAQAEIDAVRAKRGAGAAAAVAALSDSALLDEAEGILRRAEVAEGVGRAFGATATDGWTSAYWSAIFMLLTIAIVAGGIAAGIERACRVLMPALIVLVLAMVLYGLVAHTRGFMEAVDFVFRPDPSRLKPSGVLEALGHAFFTLSLGMGAMITYGSYQRTERERAGKGLVGESVAIAGLDTGIALLACLMIFPIVFSYGQAPGAGPGLVFKGMPLAFSEIGAGGMLLAIMFFGLLVFAALTSSISLLEVVASYFIDERGWGRAKAAWIVGGVIFLFSMPVAFANDPGFVMSGWAPSFGMDYFDTMDHLASNWMLPLGGLLISIYAGWVMPRRLRDLQLDGLSPAIVTGWLLLVRLVAPALVLIVLFQKIGAIDADELAAWFTR
ncbi:MAG TPA: sodium-dependent transporter [Phycisphaerales bacterium]|nr:sodium-dependent transporter [Phycisphaerales bacterium]HMP36708.1 sodium-dependent transporter [Phycisphaerales bacterium]